MELKAVHDERRETRVFTVIMGNRLRLVTNMTDLSPLYAGDALIRV